jgi:hypothetical protein
MAIAGKVAVTPRGNFQSGTSYSRLDYVKYGRNTYIAKKDNVNILPTDTNYWMLSTEGVDLEGDTKNNTVTFSTATTRENISSGEEHSVLFGKIAKFFSDLKAVAFTGSYNDLSDKPTIPSAVAVKGNAETTYRTGNVNITASNIGLGNVGNFKAVSTVASQGLTDTEKSNARTNIGAGTSSFSGSYTDLTDKPTIPTVNNATLTIQKNGTTVKTFTANASSNVTANITVPTKVSELTNDSGYKTTDTTYSIATTSANGLMSSTDKSKLDGVATGAQVNSITGVKGNSESNYRTGNVNLTPANLGALATNGDSKSNTTTFTTGDTTTANATSWTDVTQITSGLTHANLFQRISQMCKNVRYLYNNIGKIKGIIESLDDCVATTEDGYAASAKALNELNSNLAFRNNDNNCSYYAMYNGDNKLFDFLGDTVVQGGYYVSKTETAEAYNLPSRGFVWIFGSSTRFCIILIHPDGNKLWVRTNWTREFTQLI